MQKNRKKKMRSERIIMFGAIKAGYTFREVNDLLGEAGFRPMNENSFHMVKKLYLPHIFGGHAVNQKLRKQVEHPDSVGNLGKSKST